MQRCIADIDKENSLASSMLTEANEVIEMATRERDKAQEELDKAQFSANAVAERLSGWEHYAEEFTATCNEAQIKGNNAQKNLEDLKVETQRLEYRRDRAIVNIGRLRDQLEEQQMVVNNETKKKTGLFAIRNIMELLSSSRISTLTLSHFEDLEKYTRDLMDGIREPRSISQARDT
jgi:chromosome segregation ATPase